MQYGALYFLFISISSLLVTDKPQTTAQSSFVNNFKFYHNKIHKFDSVLKPFNSLFSHKLTKIKTPNYDPLTNLAETCQDGFAHRIYKIIINKLNLTNQNFFNHNTKFEPLCDAKLEVEQSLFKRLTDLADTHSKQTNKSYKNGIAHSVYKILVEEPDDQKQNIFDRDDRVKPLYDRGAQLEQKYTAEDTHVDFAEIFPSKMEVQIEHNDLEMDKMDKLDINRQVYAQEIITTAKQR